MKNGFLSIFIISMLVVYGVTKPNQANAKHIFGIGHIKIDPIVLIPIIGPTLGGAKVIDEVAKAVGVESDIAGTLYEEVAAYGNLSTDALKAIVRLDIAELGRIGIAAIARTGLLSPLTDLIFYSLYTDYIAKKVLDPNSVSIRLHPDFISIYQDDFKEDLRNVTIRVSKQGSTSLTDCQIIYFQRGNVARNALAQIGTNTVGGVPFVSSFNTANSQLELLLHELEHVDQCKEVGGRRKYALNWFYNLIVTGVLTPEIVLLAGSAPIAGIAFLATVDPDRIHDAMPLEIKAMNEATINARNHLNPHAPVTR